MQNPSSKSAHASAVVSVSGWSSLVSHKMDAYAHKYLCNHPFYELQNIFFATRNRKKKIKYGGSKPVKNQIN
jgi:hypothetical protein